MSWDRYCAICLRHKRYLRSKSTALTTLVVLSIAVFILFIPLPYFAEESEQHHMRLCRAPVMDEWMMPVFIFYTFILGYCIPFFCIILFNSLILWKLKKQHQNFRQSRIPLKSIALKTLRLIGFYFFCWTPYWVATLYYLFNRRVSNHYVFIHVMYIAYALPYVNSALNWVFYSLLNAQVEMFTKPNRTKEEVDLSNFLVGLERNRHTNEMDPTFFLSDLNEEHIELFLEGDLRAHEQEIGDRATEYEGGTYEGSKEEEIPRIDDESTPNVTTVCIEYQASV